MRIVAVLILALLAVRSRADALQWSGFALLRAGSEDEPLSAQVQLGLDWQPSMTFGAHVHLLARSDEDGSRRGRAGMVQAWLDQNVGRGEHRFRFMEGAFFLPGSRENVDALWESPYTISSSALNSWLGEELRPVGVDASYTLRRRWSVGATAYSGNDTFGALPAVRGWRLHDRWTLLGERVPVDPEYFTSVSAETDHRTGWAARGRYSANGVTLQAMRVDNRSDALEHGDLLNWLTRFDVVSADFTRGDWTLIAESGRGFTDVVVEGERFRTDLSTTYVLASRRLSSGRASLRAEMFDVDDRREHAVTAAYFWSPGRLRVGGEAVVIGDERRVTLELRYYF